MLTLVLALALADAPRPAAQPTRKPVTAASFRPTVCDVGGQVTVEGSGFDQGTIVLVGNRSPRIVSRSETQLVFVAPVDSKKPEGYSADVFLVTPGAPLLSLGVLQVQRGAAASGSQTRDPRAIVPLPDGPVRLLDVTISVSAGTPKAVSFDLAGSNAASVSLSCAGGDVTVSAHPAGSSEPALSAETTEGALRWTLSQRALGATAETPRGKVDLTVATESKTPVSCTLRIGRSAKPSPVK